MSGYRPSCNDACPAPFAALVHDCTRLHPLKRPSAAEVCSRLTVALETLQPPLPCTGAKFNTPQGSRSPPDTVEAKAERAIHQSRWSFGCLCAKF